MANIINPGTKTTTQSYITFIIIGVMALFIFLAAIVIFGAFGFQTGQERLAVSLLLFWVGILLSYYVWAIYYYNINLGYSEKEWQAMWLRADTAKRRKDAGMDYDQDDLKLPEDNPYKDETFGLPAGTVRGTIALTLLMGGISMFIMSIGNPRFNFYENFDFFIQAFLMMVAFYFGSKALGYLSTDKSKKAEKEIPPETPSLPQTPSALESVVEKAVKKVTEKKEAEELETEFPQVKQQEENKKLTDEAIIETARSLKIEPAVLKAVTAVESSGSGFLQDGRPKILFEGHIFWRELKKRNVDPAQYAVAHQDILYEKWTRKYYKGGAGEYDRLERAKLINEDAALCSASWGLFQIMGFNHKLAGFETVKDYVEKMYESEKEHLKAFLNFIKSQKMLPLLKEKNWAAFAKRYNGPAYAKNKYDIKLADAYERYKAVMGDDGTTA